MPDQPSPDPVSFRGTLEDPAALRAFAHPTRNRILEELGARGSARAADLATALGLPANQLSFHLRELARFGLIEDAPELAKDGRDRVWRTRYERGLRIEPHTLRTVPGGAAAVEVWSRQGAARTREGVDRAWALEAGGDQRVSISDVALRLSSEEAHALSEELQAVVDRWRETGRSAEHADTRDTYALLQILQPVEGADGT